MITYISYITIQVMQLLSIWHRYFDIPDPSFALLKIFVIFSFRSGLKVMINVTKNKDPITIGL